MKEELKLVGEKKEKRKHTKKPPLNVPFSPPLAKILQYYFDPGKALKRRSNFLLEKEEKTSQREMMLKVKVFFLCISVDWWYAVGVFFTSDKLMLWPLVAHVVQDILAHSTFCVHCNGSLSRSGVRAKTGTEENNGDSKWKTESET